MEPTTQFPAATASCETTRPPTRITRQRRRQTRRPPLGPARCCRSAGRAPGTWVSGPRPRAQDGRHRSLRRWAAAKGERWDTEGKLSQGRGRGGSSADRAGGPLAPHPSRPPDRPRQPGVPVTGAQPRHHTARVPFRPGGDRAQSAAARGRRRGGAGGGDGAGASERPTRAFPRFRSPAGLAEPEPDSRLPFTSASDWRDPQDFRLPRRRGEAQSVARPPSCPERPRLPPGS